MPFTLLQDEELRHEANIDIKESFISFSSGSSNVKVTNFRLVHMYSKKRFGSTSLGGNEVTTYAPLEMIDSTEEGRFSKPLWLLAAIVLGVFGIIFTITLIGALAGIPMIIVGVICFFLWLGTRREGVIFRTSGEDTIEVFTAGNRRPLEDLVDAVESARLHRIQSQ